LHWITYYYLKCTVTKTLHYYFRERFNVLMEKKKQASQILRLDVSKYKYTFHLYITLKSSFKQFPAMVITTVNLVIKIKMIQNIANIKSTHITGARS